MDRYKMELHIHDNSPFTPLLNRMTRVRSSLVLVSYNITKLPGQYGHLFGSDTGIVSLHCLCFCMAGVSMHVCSFNAIQHCLSSAIFVETPSPTTFFPVFTNLQIIFLF